MKKILFILIIPLTLFIILFGCDKENDVRTLSFDVTNGISVYENEKELSSKEEYEIGKEINLLIKVDDGYVLDFWKLNDNLETKTSEINFTMPNEDSVITIKSLKLTSVSFEKIGDGEITYLDKDANGITASMLSGDDITVKAVETESMIFYAWEIDGERRSSDKEFTFKATSQDSKVVAIFIEESQKEAKTREDFDKYMDYLFVNELKGSPIDINFLLRHPENFGLENEKVEVEEMSSDDGSYDDVRNTKKAIESFDYNLLDENQKLTYDIVIDTIDTNLSFEGMDYYPLTLGSYLGYNAQLPIILAEYHFYVEKDINDYFDYIKTLKSSFVEIIDWEKERAENGFCMPNFIKQGVINQCKEFTNVADGEEHYLIGAFNDKIDALDYLSASQKEEYKNTNKELINNELLEAYMFLEDEVATIDGDSINKYGLYFYEGGSDYYEALFHKASGSSISVEDAFEYLKNKAQEEVESFANIEKMHPSIAFEMERYDFTELSDVNEIIEYFLEKCKEDFPMIDGEINVKVEEISKSLEDYSSPAMYFLSPIDSFSDEVIYINRKTFNENGINYVFSTMAHEGIPGHLLQHNIFKSNQDIPNIRKLLSYTAYSEAWTTYIEEFVLENYTTIPSYIINAYNINNRINALIYCVSDIGVHYYGWKEKDINMFVRTLGFELSSGVAKEIIEQLVEVPTNVIEYYFAYYLITDLKEDFKAECSEKGIEFSDYLFHDFYLSTGVAPFTILEQQIEVYLNKQLNN